MMIFLYGVQNTMSPELPSQARVPADTEPEALEILRKSFAGVLDEDKYGEDALAFQLLDVQEVTEPEVELSTIIIKTPNGRIWTRDIDE